MPRGTAFEFYFAVAIYIYIYILVSSSVRNLFACFKMDSDRRNPRRWPFSKRKATSNNNFFIYFHFLYLRENKNKNVIETPLTLFWWSLNLIYSKAPYHLHHTRHHIKRLPLCCFSLLNFFFLKCPSIVKVYHPLLSSYIYIHIYTRRSVLHPLSLYSSSHRN